MPTSSTSPARGGPGPTALVLGSSGLLPFVGAAVGAWLTLPGAAAALLVYAAVIVSFLGGIHWGVAMRDEAPRDVAWLWGVTPSLLGWAALLLPARAGLLLAAAALVTCYAVDRRLYAHAGLQGWLPLRLRLTAVATLSCLAGAAVP